MHTIKPIDRGHCRAAKETANIPTVEELTRPEGSAAPSRGAADEGCLDVRFKRMALPDVFVHEVGSQQWLRDQYGLGLEDVKREIRSLLAPATGT